MTNYAESRKVLGRSIAGFEVHVFEATLNPASVPANTSPGQALAVTGVKAGRIQIVSGSNDRLDVDEATTGAFAAAIAEGSYTGVDLAAALETAINAGATDNTYTVTYDGRLFTIAIDTGTTAFQILITTGANPTRTIGPTIGISADTADDTNDKVSTADVSPTGDIVLSVVPSGEDTNLAVAQGRVSDDDEVTVTLVNTTAGAIDGASQKYIVTVLRADVGPGPGLN